MLKLSDRKWKEFKIENVFCVGGTITTKPQVLIAKGNTPRVTCAAVNNGLDGLYNNASTEEKGVITIDSATIGSVFYQPYDFIATDHVEKLRLKNRYMNRYIGLFLKSAIDKAKGTKYDYGYKFSQTRIKRQTFKLPIDKNENIDYDFMEQFIKEREETKRKEYLEYVKVKMNEIKTTIRKTNGGGVANISYKAFAIKDIFTECERGRRLIKDNQIIGNTPYISSTAMNNGVDSFIGNKESVRVFKNCLSLANSGSVGSCFYEPFEFIASDHITHLKNEKLNSYHYLFIATVLNRLSEKYNFNREISDKRIEKEKVILPQKNNNIDYDFCENIIKSKMSLKYCDYIIYCENRIKRGSHSSPVRS